MKKFSLDSGDPIFELTINCPRENNNLKYAAFFIKSSLFIYLAVKGSYEKLTASPMFTSGKKRLIINSMNGKKKKHGKRWFSFWLYRNKRICQNKNTKHIWDCSFLTWWLVVQALGKFIPCDPWGDRICSTHSHPPSHREGQPQGKARHTQPPKSCPLSLLPSLCKCRYF